MARGGAVVVVAMVAAMGNLLSQDMGDGETGQVANRLASTTIVVVGLALMAAGFTLLDRGWCKVLPAIGFVDHPFAVVVGAAGLASLLVASWLRKRGK